MLCSTCFIHKLGGKCLCYASLPLAFDWIRERYAVAAISVDFLCSIMVVVSPLTLLMKYQVESLLK